MAGKTKRGGEESELGKQGQGYWAEAPHGETGPEDPDNILSEPAQHEQFGLLPAYGQMGVGALSAPLVDMTKVVAQPKAVERIHAALRWRNPSRGLAGPNTHLGQR